MTAPMDMVLSIWVTVLVGVVAGAGWQITGRLLRPVEAVRAELAAVDGHDPHARISEPSKARLAGRLARTINATLARIEQTSEQSRQTLERQRLFIADASHRLRDPVTGLRLRLEDARAHPEDTDLPDLLSCALHDVDRLQQIVTDLLDLAAVPTRRPADPEAPGRGQPTPDA
ncbi:histidine kinase dimerization/phospho-acceptor domain-containing protein [Sphaerisporangium sp. B11E5]|uniref:histidine kinase dimerization/phospho-acceptor domain-containing protein n=1 Tax=Sphaerisporangium sp. B11E5 TaxID=3153563 RepID=UPI00325F5C13